ncbi:MAG: glycosyltransferase family 39 protein [Bacteroidetes bacterium]|nr:glycosyltransferase family 39 protein [Bacteroidota bacterium]
MPKKKSKKTSNNKLQTKKSKVSLEESLNKFFQYRYLGLVIAVLYFVTLLIVSLLYHKVGDYGIETDFFWGYVPNAKSFINGDLQIDPFRGPLYPMVLGLVNLIISNYFYSGIIIGVLSASILIFLTFELVKRIFSPAVSFFVSLLLASNPIFVQYTYSAGTDMMFNVLAAATLFFFFKDKKLNYKNLLIAAVLGGLSYLTRYNGVFLLGFVFIILFVNYWNNHWLQRLKSSTVFVAIFILTFTPWGIYCLSKKGSFFYNENYKNIAYELYGKGKISWDQFWFNESSSFTSLFDVIGRDPFLFISTTIGNIGEHFLLAMERLMGMELLMGWIVGVFVILGLILVLISNPFKNWKSRETGYYLSNLFFFALLTLVFYSERFSIFLISFYSVIAIQPLFIEKFNINKRIPLKFSYLLVISLIVVNLAKSISFNSARINSGPQELLVLQDWYDENIPESERGNKIAARKAHVAYYLGMDFVLLPMANSYEELIEKLRQNNVDYLYFSPIEAAMRREFQSLLNPKSSHPGLKVVVYFNNPPAVLYRIIND